LVAKVENPTAAQVAALATTVALLPGKHFELVGRLPEGLAVEWADGRVQLFESGGKTLLANMD
jgi:hypothetical protein